MNKYTFIILFLIFSGCDRFYGVNRASPVSYIPEVGCIERLLKSVSGVTYVNHEVKEGSSPVGFFKVYPPDYLEIYTYQVEGVEINIYFNRSHDNKITYTHSYLTPNKEPKNLNTILPVMEKVDEGLKKECFKGEN